MTVVAIQLGSPAEGKSRGETENHNTEEFPPRLKEIDSAAAENKLETVLHFGYLLFQAIKIQTHTCHIITWGTIFGA